MTTVNKTKKEVARVVLHNSTKLTVLLWMIAFRVCAQDTTENSGLWYGGLSQSINVGQSASTDQIDSNSPHHGYDLFVGNRVSDRIGLELFVANLGSVGQFASGMSSELSLIGAGATLYLPTSEQMMTSLRIRYGQAKLHVYDRHGYVSGDTIVVSDAANGYGYGLGIGEWYRINPRWSAALHVDYDHFDLGSRSPWLNQNLTITSTTLSASVVYGNIFEGTPNSADRRVVAAVGGGLLGSMLVRSALMHVNPCGLMCDVHQWTGKLFATAVGGGLGAMTGLYLTRPNHQPVVGISKMF